MTVVAETTRRVGPTVGDGSTKAFSYTFKITASTDMLVLTQNTTSKTVVTKVDDVDYVVSGVGDAAGGLVTFTVAPPTTENVLLLGREPNTQPTDITLADTVFDTSLQEALDRLARLEQQFLEITNRCITMEQFWPLAPAAAVELPTPVAADAGKAVTISGVGDAATLSYGSPATITPTVTAFAETFLDDATGAAVMTTLGITTAAQGVLDDASLGAMRQSLGVQRMVMFDTPLNKATKVQVGASTSTQTATVDISADTGGDTATFAILRARVLYENVGSTTSGTPHGIITVWDNDASDPANPFRVKHEHATDTLSVFSSIVERTIITGLDSAELFEYKFDWDLTASNIYNFDLWLEGYYHQV